MLNETNEDPKFQVVGQGMQLITWWVISKMPQLGIGLLVITYLWLEVFASWALHLSEFNTTFAEAYLTTFDYCVDSF